MKGPSHSWHDSLPISAVTGCQEAPSPQQQAIAHSEHVSKVSTLPMPVSSSSFHLPVGQRWGNSSSTATCIALIRSAWFAGDSPEVLSSCAGESGKGIGR